MGVYTFTVSVSNAAETITENITVDVGDKPVVNSSISCTINQGEKLGYRISAYRNPESYGVIQIDPQTTVFKITDINKVEIGGESPYSGINDKTITFSAFAANVYDDAKVVTAKYEGRVEISYEENPQRFLLTAGDKGIASFSITNKDILKVYANIDFGKDKFNISSDDVKNWICSFFSKKPKPERIVFDRDEYRLELIRQLSARDLEAVLKKWADCGIDRATAEYCMNYFALKDSEGRKFDLIIPADPATVFLWYWYEIYCWEEIGSHFGIYY